MTTLRSRRGYSFGITAAMTDEPEARNLQLPSSPFAGRLARQQKRAEIEAKLFGAPAVARVRIGRHVVLRELGAGGMSVVYVAYDEQLDRKVAIKFLKGSSGRERDETMARLQREARAMARLSHPNVAAVHEIGEQDDELYLVMEFVDGPPLRAWLEETRSTAEVLEVLLAAAGGIAAAHEAGVIHRDIKPDNIVVGPTVKTIDFGIASTVMQQETEPGQASTGSADPLTRGMAGTPQYMAPEQFAGEPPSAATDQFSFCVTAWEALYGLHPFPLADREAPGVLRDPLQGERPLDRATFDALRRGLSVDADARHPSMQALIEALRPRPPRRLWLPVSVGAVGVVAAFVALQPDEAAARCTGAEAALGSAWQAERKQEVERAIAEPYGETTWASVGSQIDDYATRWIDSHRDACLTNDRGEQSVAILDDRMRCLDRARRALDASTALLAEGDAAVLENATQLVEALPALDRCDDLEALESDVPAPPAGQAEDVDKVRTALAQARARMVAGAYDEAEARAKQVVADADAIGYGPLSVEAKLVHGDALREVGNYEDAERILGEALVSAMANLQWLEAYDSALDLARLEGALLDRAGSGRAWLKTAEGLRERVGDDPKRRARFFLTRASVAERTGEYAAAKEDLETALEQLESVDGATSRRANALRMLARTMHRLGEPEKAVALQRESAALLVEELGPEHPQVGVARENVASLLSEIGRLDEAATELDAALAIETRAWGRDSPRLLTARMTRVQLLRRQGKPVEAEAEAREVLEGRRRVLGDRHFDTLMTQTSLAVTIAMQGRHDESEPILADAVKTLDETAGPEHQATLSARHNYTMLLARMQRYADAERELRPLIAAKRKAAGPEHPSVLPTWTLHAAMLAELDREVEAAAEYAQAIEQFERVMPPDHQDLASARLDYGTLLYDLGRFEEAKAMLELAWVSYGANEAISRRTAEVIYGMALVLADLRDDELPTWLERAKKAREVGMLSQKRWERIKDTMAKPATRGE